MTVTNRFIVFTMLLVLLTAGCTSSVTDLSNLPAEEMTGIYISENGGSWFRPCDRRSGEAMWVTFTDAAATWAHQARSSGELHDGTWYFVRWRAAVTTGGEIGPGGPGVPALLVREVYEIGPDANGDCTPDVARF